MLNGRIIRAIRVTKGLHLQEIADQAGFSAAWLSAVELGRHKLSRRTEERLLSVYAELGITEQDIDNFAKAVRGVEER